jgi:hypothetical protein
MCSNNYLYKIVFIDVSINKDEELIDIVHETKVPTTNKEVIETSVIKPQGIIDWYDNKALSNLKTLIRKIDYGVVISVLIFLLVAFLIKVDYFLIVLISAFILSLSIIFHWVSNLVPKKIGLSTKGIHFQYKGKKPPFGKIEFIPWIEIGIIHRQNPKLLKFVFKTIPKNMQFNEDYYEFDVELQQKVLDAFERSKDDTGHRHKRTDVEKPQTSVKGTTKDSVDKIKWVENDFYRKDRYWNWAIAIFITFGALVFVLYKFSISDPENFFFYLIILILPIFMLLFDRLLQNIIPLKVGFSDKGIHFHYRKVAANQIQVWSISWTELKWMEPIISRNIRFKMHTGEEHRFFTMSEKVLQTIADNIDSRYLLGHPMEKQPEMKPEPLSWEVNKSYRTVQLYIWIPLIFAIIYLIPLPFIFYSKFTILLMIIILATTPMLIFGIIIPAEYYFDLTTVPTSVAFTKHGLFARYGRFKRDHGLIASIRWDEIGDIPEITQALSSSPVFQGFKRSRMEENLVIIKKSGTSFLLGPIDKTIKQRIIENYESVKKEETSKEDRFQV